ncbi:phenol hydroxylase subunit [Pseudomonas putida]
MNHPTSALDHLPRYVRVRSGEQDTFVEFDFAIGSPELYVELVLPRPAFQQFCLTNRVQHMNAQMSEAINADMQKWRYGESAQESSD